ncbi:TadE/TadG family type IV pilus assembly protein [Photobacterium profundum]|uniref:TadE/TadG family type IV pilus assembly protein n=1 Tax=Photobacterium profundum TaxID=74109 RepID=UPI0002EB07D0|nr:TadE family protein [Photobacterium profundum]
MNRHKQRGVFSIEFAMSAIVLFLVTFAIFEASRLIYIINLTESALRESTRDTRVFESKRYNTAYENRLQQIFEGEGEIWHYLVKPARYRFSITYYDTYQNLIKDTPHIGECQRCELALYSLQYRYLPMFFIGNVVDRTITRDILAEQEHEGWPINEE